jgi:hypothetical protein
MASTYERLPPVTVRHRSWRRCRNPWLRKKPKSMRAE